MLVGRVPSVKSLVLSLLFSSIALAQGNTGQSTTGVSRGNGLRIPQYRTAGTGALSFFVATTGSDANDCRAVGTPCLTIQAATNKIPKLLRDQVTVNVAAGSYAGFYISGFSADTGIQQTSAGLLYDGALANSTPATGTATGTATGATQGSGLTFGTLTDSGQTWTVNDLRGKFLVITAGTGVGQVRVISSNTATAITIVSTFTTTPTGASYAIQQPSVIITSTVVSPPTPINTAGSGTAGISTNNNSLTWKPGAISIRNFDITTTGSGFRPNDGSQYTLTQTRIDTSSTAGISAITLSAGAATGPTVTLLDVYLVPNTTGSGINSIDSNFNLNISRSLINGGAYGVISNGSLMFANVSTGITGELLNQTTAGLAIYPGGTITLQNLRITCLNSSGVGLIVGAATATGTGGPSSVITTGTGINVATCGTGAVVRNNGVASLTLLAGAAATTGIQILMGGLAIIGAGTTITAGTQEFSLDSDVVVGSFSDVASASCVGNSQYVSRICR